MGEIERGFEIQGCKLGTVKTVARRAGIELRGEDGQPYHCGQRMHVKGGIFGSDWARCEACGLTMANYASPHINHGRLFDDDWYEKWGHRCWTAWEAP